METKDFFAVAIGASGGGIGALTEFFKSIMPRGDIAYIVITHIKPDHFSRLDQILSRHTAIPVHRVTKNVDIRPGNIYLLIEKTFLTVENGRLLIRTREPKEVVNYAVNIFFKSLAADFGSRAVGIILSGSGRDGLEGVMSIEEAGGYVMVQTPDTSFFTGMPNAVIDNDRPDIVASPIELARHLVRWIDAEKEKNNAQDKSNSI